MSNTLQKDTYMYLTIKEAFQIFTEENPNTKIKLS